MTTLRVNHLRTRHLKSLLPDQNWFGQKAESFARVFGTPKFIIWQSCIIVLWIFLNVLLVALRWDPYPFILLNLVFSTQAAYAAPLILLAQNRDADREKIKSELMFEHNIRTEVMMKMVALQMGIDNDAVEKLVTEAITVDTSKIEA